MSISVSAEPFAFLAALTQLREPAPDVSGPMNVCVSVVGNSTSTWQLDYTVDDPSGAFPNPTLDASAPTVFSSLNGSSTPT